MLFNRKSNEKELPYIWHDIQHRKFFVWHWEGVSETINLSVSVILKSLKWVIEPSSTCASQAAQIPKDSDEELLRFKATAKNLSYTNKWFLKLWLLGCEFSQVCLKHTLDVLAFQFLSLRTGALLVSAHPLYWGNITVKTLCWRPKVPANVQQLVLAVKTVPDPTEQQKEELQGKAEMQLLSVPTSGWDFMGSSSSSFPRMCKCPAMQTFLFCSSSCPMLSQAAFPGRLKINHVQLQLCHQAADWWLQFQDFDKWKSSKSSKVVFIQPLWNQHIKRGGRFVN